MERLTEFKGQKVSYLETMHIKEGVACDVYSFVGDSSRDLGIIIVNGGRKTPLQRVVKGDKTIEGHISGRGTLKVQDEKGKTKTYSFEGEHGGEVVIFVGQKVQWEAAQNSDLLFYEICEPPYEDGRFENLD